jgi:hypothetical protein
MYMFSILLLDQISLRRQKCVVRAVLSQIVLYGYPVEHRLRQHAASSRQFGVEEHISNLSVGRLRAQGGPDILKVTGINTNSL